MAELNRLLLDAQTSRLISDIMCWLRPPNPSSNLSNARKKRQKDTGVWFLQSPIFASWKTTPQSCLWLSGKPGSGKTVLNSTVVQALFEERDATTSIVYFYFDFQSRDKIQSEGLLTSLIVQLLTQEKLALQEAQLLYKLHYSGANMPDVDQMKETIRKMFASCPKLYLVVDALDECEDRRHLLGFLAECHGWGLANVHILATSRRETDIEDSMRKIATSQISLEDSVVDGDILAYVRQELKDDPNLSQWPEDVRKEVETSLLNGSNGMFRWTECQLNALRDCMKLGHLRRTLRSLPETLDDTYSRILQNIPKAYKEDARRILACLIHSYYPLSVQEIADTVAIVTQGETYYNDEERLFQPFDILKICSGLVIVTSSLRNTEIGFYQMPYQELRLAHFSVKEYLVSEREVAGRPPDFRFDERSTHEILAGLCIRYLLHCHQRGLCNDSKRLMSYYMHVWEDAAFGPYAAAFWSRHLRAAQVDDASSLLRLSLNMVTRPACLRDVMRIRRPWFDLREVEIMQQYGCRKSREHFHDETIDMTVDAVPPLFYVSLLGVDQLVTLLIDNGADVNETCPQGTSLAAAAAGGQYSTVELLIEKGADLNLTVYQRTVEGSICRSRTAIHEAVCRRWFQVAELLLAKGADLNIGVLCNGSNPDHIKYNIPLDSVSFYRGFEPEHLLVLMIKAGAVSK